jgi:glycosyltransferase involved in cell wall biosynthesis
MLTAGPKGNAFSSGQEARVPTIWWVLDLAPNKRGSLEAQLVALAERLRDDGVRVTCVLAGAPPSWLADALGRHGVALRILDFRRPGVAAWRFGRAVAAARPHLVHFHFVRAYSPLVALARGCGARVVLHDHMMLGQPLVATRARGAVEAELAQAYKWARAVALNRLVDVRVAVSGSVAASVRACEHVDGARQRVLEHGVDLCRFSGADGSSLRTELRADGRPLVACVSRLAPEKGVSVLIRALARVGRDALLLVVGDGPDAPACQALAAALGLGDHVRFLGRRDDVERVYAAADVAVAPSLGAEAFGLCVVEAMASGRPVVVSDAGALPEIVEHGRSGLVVPRGDAAALAGAIGRLVDEPALAARLAAAGRARARAAYGLERWTGRVEALYASLLPSLYVRAPGPTPPLPRAA